MEKALLKVILDQQVDSIADPELKNLVYKILDKLPSAFWERESSKKYHPVDERGDSGNLAHTLKVTKLIGKILESTSYNQEDKDLARAAGILHDCMRHGLEGKAPWSTKDHPQLVRQFIKAQNLECELSNKLCAIIETHMGPWGITPYFPELSLNAVLHIADCLAAQTDLGVSL